MRDERQLTELEGAILEAVEYRGQNTAYKIRRALERSFSVQWRGSAGAVSPAVHRLVDRGMLESSPHPSRRGQILSLTALGKSALQAWALNAELGSGAGMDPFRLRAGIWKSLPAGAQRTFFAKLERQLSSEIDKLQSREIEDALDRVQTELAIQLLRSRLEWLSRQGSGGRRVPTKD